MSGLKEFMRRLRSSDGNGFKERRAQADWRLAEAEQKYMSVRERIDAGRQEIRRAISSYAQRTDQQDKAQLQLAAPIGGLMRARVKR